MTSSLRVLILTPTAMPSITGNALTVERWRRSLIPQGVSVSVLPTKQLDPSALITVLKQFKPDLFHIHHAFQAAAPLFHPQIESLISRIPLVVSPGGTDLNIDLGTKNGCAIIPRMFSKARFIITQSENMSDLITTAMPRFKDRVVLVPKSFTWFGYDFFDLRKTAHCKAGDILFFMPAGLRPVKGNLDFLLNMKQAFSARPHLRIVFSGPPLDTGYSQQFEEVLKRFAPLATWIPAIPPSAMRSAYKSADVVVNASASEGLSNALIEAMAAGRAVLASNISGNRYPLLGNNGDSPAGLLYNREDSNDLYTNALRLIDDKGLRDQLGNTGTVRAKHISTPEVEAAHLIEVYDRAVNNFPVPC